MVRLRQILFLIALAGVSAVPFLRCLGHGLSGLDDYVYLLMGPPEDVFVFAEAIWMPLTRLTYLVDSWIWGDWWGGFHLTSILIHAANAVLVWMLLVEIHRRIGADGESRGADWGPALCAVAALFWAIHPLRCESVVLLSSRKDLVSFFFELVALLCWMRGTRRATLAALGLFLLAYTAKPSVMTFPVLCFLLDAFIIREVRPSRYLEPVVLMVAMGVFAAWQQAAGGATEDHFNQPLWGRLLEAAAAFGIYVRNTLRPTELAAQCVKRWPELPRFWLPGLLVSAAWGAYLLKRFAVHWKLRGGSRPADPLLAGFAWFAFAVGPMLGIANFGYHAFADRFTYIPAVGFSIAVLAVPRRFWKAATFVLAAAVVACGCLTWRQTGYWEDDGKLFTHTLEVDGDRNTAAHFALGIWYYEVPHDLERCVREFEKVERQDVLSFRDSLEIYIYALCELGRTERIGEILAAYESALIGWVGKEAWERAWTDGGGHDTASRHRQIYRLAKAAWWAADPATLPLAEEYLRETAYHGERRDFVWLLMKWRFLEAKHGRDSAEAIEAKRVLLEEGGRVGFIQGRYLRLDKTPVYRPYVGAADGRER